MNSLISLRDFALRLHAGESDEQILGPKERRTGKLFAPDGHLKMVNDADRSVEFVISTASVDRMTDTIDVNGWQLGHFERNPVVLWSHDASTPAIARASGTRVEGGVLKSIATFATRDIHPLADTVYQLCKAGFISTSSVGFLPKSYEFSNDEDREWGVDFKTVELLEWSVCNIPANPDCLVVGRSMGIDTSPIAEWAEKILDGGGKIMIPKTELNRLRKAAKEPPMARRTTRRRAEDDDKPDDDDKNKATGNCGRDPDEACGMKDPNECSVHAGKAADPEKPEDDDQDEKRLRRLLLRLLGPRRRAEGDEPADHDEAPLAHEDAIRMAHKSLRTSKAFMTEAVSQHSKAMVHLQGVVDALDVDGSDKPEDEAEEPDGDEGDPAAAKAAQLRRAADLKARLRPN